VSVDYSYSSVYRVQRIKHPDFARFHRRLACLAPRLARLLTHTQFRVRNPFSSSACEHPSTLNRCGQQTRGTNGRRPGPGNYHPTTPARVNCVHDLFPYFGIGWQRSPPPPPEDIGPHGSRAGTSWVVGRAWSKKTVNRVVQVRVVLL